MIVLKWLLVYCYISFPVTVEKYKLHKWFAIVVSQSPSHFQLFATPWTTAHLGFLGLHCLQLRLISIDSGMPSNHLILCHPFSFCPQSFPALESFLVGQLFTSGSQCIRASASAPVLPMNIQRWFPLGLTGLISLLSKGLSEVFSSTIWKHCLFAAQSSLWSSSHIQTWILEKP